MVHYCQIGWVNSVLCTHSLITAPSLDFATQYPIVSRKVLRLQVQRGEYAAPKLCYLSWTIQNNFLQIYQDPEVQEKQQDEEKEIQNCHHHCKIHQADQRDPIKSVAIFV